MKEILFINSVFDRFSIGSSKEEENEPEYTIGDYKTILNEYRDAEAEILINIATLYFEDENITESMNHLKKAIQIYKGLEDIEKQALVFDIMGDINRYNKKISKALENYRESYHLYSKIKSDNKEEIAGKIKDLEIIKSAGIDKTSYNIKESAFDAPTEVPGDEFSISNFNKINNNIKEVIGMLRGGDTYLSYLKSDNPVEKLQKAYEKSNNREKATILLVMGNSSLENSKTSTAIKCFQKSLKYFLEIDDKEGEAATRLLIGTVYYIIGDMDRVNLNFRKSIKLFKDSKDVFGENIALRLLNTIYEE